MRTQHVRGTVAANPSIFFRISGFSASPSTTQAPPPLELVLLLEVALVDEDALVDDVLVDDVLVDDVLLEDAPPAPPPLDEVPLLDVALVLASLPPAATTTSTQ